MKAVRALALAMGLSLFSCGHHDLVLGFAASFSGSDYVLGVEGRNAAEIYVRNLNQSGGIGGRKLRLEIRDFRSSLDNIVPSDRELLDAGALAIVGHYTSASAEAALDFAATEKIALISPSATSESLSGKDDWFFRSIMSSKNDPVLLGNIMLRNGVASLAIIKTAQNKPYTETYAAYFRGKFRISAEIEYSDIRKVDFGTLRESRGYDAVIILASSIDSGTIAQALGVEGLLKPLYLSGWAANQDLVEYGGAAVEGAVFVHQVDGGAVAMKDLAAEFVRVYGVEPGYAALETWDAMQLAKTAFDRGAKDRKSFYDEIRLIRSFPGSLGEIRMDANGDAIRPVYEKTVRNGTIIVVAKVE